MAISLPNNLVVAPMAGVTDRPFRQLCKRLGAGYAVSEMVASNPRLWATEKSQRRTDHRGEVAPIAVQIAGADPALMADAARYNVERGAQIIDINMGCPAKKVCNVAAGSALLANEPLVAAILDAVVRAVDVPVTLKIRTGPIAASTATRSRIARIAEDAGIAALAVHGRTRACAFVGPGRVRHDPRGQARGARFRSSRTATSTRREQARAGARRTRAPTPLMIGRAAQGRPWIFREIAPLPRPPATLLPPPTVAEVRAADPRAPGRSLRVLRRGGGRAHRAQAPAAGTRADLAGGDDVPARGQRGRNVAAQLAAVNRFFDSLADAASASTTARTRGSSTRQRSAGIDRHRFGGGGPRRVRKNTRINGSNEIGRSVEKSLDEYFRRLDGEPPHGIYDMVISQVERALITLDAWSARAATRRRRPTCWA